MLGAILVAKFLVTVKITTLILACCPDLISALRMHIEWLRGKATKYHIHCYL